MISHDYSTMFWKERKSLFRMRSRRSQFIMLMVTPILLSVIFPIQMGKDWLVSGMNLAVAVIIPMLFVGTSIPDSFAGERERNTLPTLLASRLSDRVIFIGKISISILFGWLMTLLFVALSTIAVNIATWDGQIAFYSPALLIGNVTISFLMAVITAGAGVLFSLRASTVQQAQQTLMAVMLIPLLLVQVVVFVLLASQTGRDRLHEMTTIITIEQIVITATLLLLVLAAFILWAASRQFKREKLILY
jgi:ABC-2 type transport system permease protein